MAFDLDDFINVEPNKERSGIANIPNCSISKYKTLRLNKKLMEIFNPNKYVEILFKDNIIAVRKTDKEVFKVTKSLGKDNVVKTGTISLNSVIAKMKIEIKETVYFDLVELTDSYFLIDVSNRKSKKSELGNVLGVEENDK